MNFVILEHSEKNVNSKHYDLMLERNGVLKTWQLDDVPSLGRILDARQIFDHRIKYLDYEGPLSNNKGSVRQQTKGVYEPLKWTESLIKVKLTFGKNKQILLLKKIEKDLWNLEIVKA